MTNKPEGAAAGKKVRPAYFAHFVIKTSKYEEAVKWYQNFFDAEIVHAAAPITFLTFDDEHHRVAIANIPGLEPQNETTAGIEHVAFSFKALDELVHTYERLKALGIVPFWCINHGTTTSMYYKDPDGNRVELQVDCSAEPGVARAFFDSDAFARNPIGVEYDPDLLVGKFHAGVPVEELLLQGSVPLKPGAEPFFKPFVPV